MSRSARSVLVVSTLSHFTQHLYVGIAILYPQIMEALNISYTELGLAVGLASVLTGSLQLFFGLFARYAPRRILLGLGNVFLSIGAAGIGLARNLYNLILANVLGAVGSSAQHPVGVSIISDKYRKEAMGSALGFHYGIAYIGNIVSPLILTAIASLQSWRTALYFIAVPPALTSLMLLFYLRKEPSAGKIMEQSSLRTDVAAAFKRKEVMIVIGANALLAAGTGQGALVAYTPSFLEKGIRMDHVQASFLFSVMMLGGVIGTVLIGKYSNRIGYLESALLSTWTASAMIFTLTFFSGPNTMLILNLFILGLSNFAILSLFQAYLSSISTSSERTVILGLFFTITFGAAAVWSIVIGRIIDLYYFVPAYVFMSALTLFASLLLLYVKLKTASRLKQTTDLKTK